MPPCLPEYCGCVPALTPVQWLSPGEPPLAYLAWRLLAAAIALAGLLQSIVQNTLEFIEKEQEENIYKHFIYLTNNGRLVAALALGLEVCLSQSKFGLCPAGDATYSMRFYECLMCLTCWMS